MNRPYRPVCRAGVLAGSLLCLAVALPAATQTTHEQEHEHGHEHGHAGGAVANLQLDEGRKWATDEPLRAGMAAIRDAFDADHPAIHHGEQTDAQYEALAGRIETQVQSIVANCRLPPAPDANLHYIIADLMQGVGFMRGQDPARSRHAGAARVHGALIAYGEFFDDPGFATSDPHGQH